VGARTRRTSRGLLILVEETPEPVVSSAEDFADAGGGAGGEDRDVAPAAVVVCGPCDEGVGELGEGGPVR
jgi:uncharacterized Ntn-hydrolase superfamily protein